MPAPPIGSGMSVIAYSAPGPDTDLVGETPMQYLAGWRMHLARRMLRESNIGVAELATRGLRVRSGLHRALRRTVGMPPATWRDANAAETNQRAIVSEIRCLF
jgi:AraC-like DNA-binding protein